MTNPAAAGQRILLISREISPQLVINIIREHFRELQNWVMVGEADKIFPDGVHPTGWNTSRSLEILGDANWQNIGLERNVVDTVRCLLELEREWNKQ